MTEQDRVLIEQLIETINNTDWWMWSVTLFSAITSLTLSYLLLRATKKIGERQNQLEQYRIYKDLYKKVLAINNFSKHFINTIYEYFLYFKDDSTKMKIKSLNNQIDSFSNKLNESEADFNLLLTPKDMVSFSGLNLLLSIEKNIVSHLSYCIDSYNNKKYEIRRLSSEDYKLLYDEDNEKYKRNIINKSLEINDVEPKGFISSIDSFIKMRKILFGENDNILDTIKAKSKVK